MVSKVPPFRAMACHGSPSKENIISCNLLRLLLLPFCCSREASNSGTGGLGPVKGTLPCSVLFLSRSDPSHIGRGLIIHFPLQIILLVCYLCFQSLLQLARVFRWSLALNRPCSSAFGAIPLDHCAGSLAGSMGTLKGGRCITCTRLCNNCTLFCCR